VVAHTSTRIIHYMAAARIRVTIDELVETNKSKVSFNSTKSLLHPAVQVQAMEQGHDQHCR